MKVVGRPAPQIDAPNHPLAAKRLPDQLGVAIPSRQPILVGLEIDVHGGRRLKLLCARLPIAVLPAALLLPVHRQTALDVGAVGRGCDEQLRRPGGCSEGCYRSRGRGTRAGPLRRPAGCGEWCCTRRRCRGRAEQLRRPGRCGEWCCRRRGRGRAGPRIDRALQAQAEHWLSAPNWLAKRTSHHAEAGRRSAGVAKTEDCRFMSQKARDAKGVAGRPATHEAL